MRIPLAVPDLTGNEEQYVVRAIRSSWISSMGEFIERFEQQFADLCNVRAAISVANGTVALHMALLALGAKSGDEVLVPSLTYVATANAVRYVGAEPVFVDVDPATWCMDPTLLEERVTPRTRGIIAVHLYGHPCDMDAINRLAATRNLWVIEDAAEAHLAAYKGKPVGGLASIGTFSFYGNKILTCGEGGAITVTDPDLEARMRMLRGQGMDPNRRYYFPIIGYNYRLSNLACAILCAQLERREALLQRRRSVFAAYRRLLAGVPGIGFQPAALWAAAAPWLYCITVNRREYGLTRDEVMARLAEEGVETRPFFIPVHRLPPYAEASARRGEELPVTDRLAAEGMNLPTHTQLGSADIERIADLIRRFPR